MLKTLSEALTMIEKKSDVREVLLAILDRDELSQKERNNIIKGIIADLLEQKLPEMTKIITQDILAKIPSFIPDPIPGGKGEPGRNAPTLAEIIRAVPKPKDGYTPKKGVDYVDGKDGQDAPTLAEILAEVDKKLPELVKTYAPQRNYSLVPRRSNAYFKVLTITGTQDGSNREFYLSEAPRQGADLFVFMNGLWLSPSDQLTVSGVTLTLDNSVPAPRSGWAFYALTFKP